MPAVREKRLAQLDPVAFLDLEDRAEPRIVATQQRDRRHVRTLGDFLFRRALERNIQTINAHRKYSVHHHGAFLPAIPSREANISLQRGACHESGRQSSL